MTASGREQPAANPVTTLSFKVRFRPYPPPETFYQCAFPKKKRSINDEYPALKVNMRTLGLADFVEEVHDYQHSEALPQSLNDGKRGQPEHLLCPLRLPQPERQSDYLRHHANRFLT